jgi:hypothetical protein
MLVARWLWRELGLENILDGLASKTKVFGRKLRISESRWAGQGVRKEGL